MGGSSKPVAIHQAKIAEIQIQTSNYGGVVPIVYGSNRVSGNLIWYRDFTATQHNETQQGGKGGGGTRITQTNYTYTAAIMLAIAEGPIDVDALWKDKAYGSLDFHGFTLLTGARDQAPWSYLTSAHPSEALGYAGTAIAAAALCDLGNTGSLSNYSFHVKGFFVIAGDNYDAHPADIIPDFLTNEFYGAGWSPARIGDLARYRAYCTAFGMWISPVFAEQKPALAHLEELLRATNSEAVWSQGVLKIIPNGDTPLTANGATYTPITTPAYDLGPDDFLSARSDDPVTIERGSPSDAFNCVPVEFANRDQYYAPSVVEDADPVDVESAGIRKSQVVSLHCITRAAHALQISRIEAQRNVYCRNTYRFRLGWKYALLEPMDLVTLTDPVLGLDHRVVKIIEVVEDADGALDVRAEEWPSGVATATLYTPQGTNPDATNVDVDPGDATDPLIFDAPSLLTDGGDPEVWLATSGGAQWGGCDVWVSFDNATYTKVGRVAAKARFGTLTATLASGAQDDQTNTLAVALNSGTLVSCSVDDKDDLVTLCFVDGEFLAFETAALTGTLAYNLTKLRRGTHGSTIGSHASGSGFARLDDAIFRYAVPSSRIGEQFWVKLQSFNIYGGGMQDLSDVTAHTFTTTAAKYVPPKPSACTITQTLAVPGTSGTQSRRTASEDDQGAGADPATGDPVIRFLRYAKVDWTYTLPYPAALLAGFRVVYHEGTDPDDESKYIADPQVVAAGVRTFVLAVPSGIGARTFYAAVQAIYHNELESSWRSSAGSVTVNPDPLRIARGSLGNVTSNLDNLVPNANSELGAEVDGVDPEGNSLVEDAANAFAGDWCRKIGDGSTGAVDETFTRQVPCLAEDHFSFSAAVKRSAGTAAVTIYLDWYSAAGSLISSASKAITLTNGVYAIDSLTASAPATAVAVQARIGRAADAGGSAVYIDQLSLRRSVMTGHMEPDAGFRVINALANSGALDTSRVWYRGNCDPATLGGAPNIACLTVTRRTWLTTAKIGILELKLAPTAASDNLDGMRFAKVVWFRQSTPGTTATIVEIMTTYHPLPDRIYNVPGTDSDAANVAYITAQMYSASISSAYVAAKVTLYNAHGPSDTHCFYAATGQVDGSVLADNGTSWPAGITGGSGGGSGGGGGGGGRCPSVWVPIRLPRGMQIEAGRLIVGDFVQTIPEDGGEPGAYPVTAIEYADAQLIRVRLKDGRGPAFSVGHRVRIASGEWRAVETLDHGDVIDGDVPGVVHDVLAWGIGVVVKITVDEAHTFIADGLLSHNMKVPEVY
jgi:hypothetical protein